ncbi:ATPase [Elizabethkingia miricola]|nr:AAA domain-containing protein [Elizabethkingia miricola]NHQ70441.1 AAA domain-containing protein [Elizabethkingia miricola]PSL87315.1 ATPase [Elizabethkingia miricola]QHQ88942.1 ATPase [Elizabethkingia miricola]
MCTIVNEERLKTLIKLLNKNILNCNIPITEDWFKNSYAVWKYYLENLGETEPYNHITLPWQTYATLLNKTNKTNEMEDSQHKKLLEYKKQIILQGPPGTGKTRRAKEIALEMLGLNDTEELKNNEQFKLIQFHPSYTYEDFVRGIVSKPNEDGDGIIYEAEDKVLADFAKKALDNYIESNKTNVIVNEDTSIFNAFIENIKDELAQNEHHKYDITEAVYLFSADETRFKYKGDNWIAHSKGLNMKFSELKKIIDLGATERQDIKKMTDAEELTRQHATYFMKVVEKYYEFEQSYQPETIQTEEVLLKNYILVIDEINRANLSSVLGELIYALEYRGKAVESIYTLDGATNERKNKLILPPNLYIIGTMNTADRSVGHIDYAIRRRFAFVDVLPKKLENDVNLIFRDDIFRMVSELFIKNYDEYSNDKNVNLIPADTLFSDFKPQDVWLGHSYFIQKKDKNKEGEEFLTPEEFSIRIQYEIIPILEEYIKDGILNELAREVIKKLKTITEGA